MNDVTSRKLGGSLIERAAQIYDFNAELRARSPQPPVTASAPLPRVAPVAEAPLVPDSYAEVSPPGDVAVVDRAMLTTNGLLVPGAPVGALAEEFRLVKRHLMVTARTLRQKDATRARTILVCSAKPNDGKTYCALNLAISMAAEREVEVILIDADFAKPDVMNRLGLADGLGLLDVLADPTIDIETCVVRTDIPQLSVLPAGTKSHDDTELLGSARTAAIISALLAADPRRVLIFDSPPVLAASPAAVLAHHAGQTVLVVRADRTVESDLREAVALLSGCEDIQLLLNAVTYAPGGRRFGSYYGQEDSK
ncbi:exopolysaccharide biosynthesis protein [Sphingomonas panacis]|uniref:Exopolysaccharide biosynthesis protein n=1 Tax=Sphingomonas panacis TaxID=1560345 RepID=A0A1B3ZD80_9SPHN|nr:exopolysaccharide biosynthesis protein [Sphingomonas panacis]AOH85385.1 exopolysaccharide biosynthesis protein [Sphingomonas panacis]